MVVCEICGKREAKFECEACGRLFCDRCGDYYYQEEEYLCYSCAYEPEDEDIEEFDCWLI
jgi:predicted RNA-binding Zn-ribbon protein involved in translation (DUF1610 family)